MTKTHFLILVKRKKEKKFPCNSIMSLHCIMNCVLTHFKTQGCKKSSWKRLCIEYRPEILSSLILSSIFRHMGWFSVFMSLSQVCVLPLRRAVRFTYRESGARLPRGENQHPSSFIGDQFFVLQHRICPEDEIRPQTPPRRDASHAPAWEKRCFSFLRIFLEVFWWSRGRAEIAFVQKRLCQISG